MKKKNAAACGALLFLSFAMPALAAHDARAANLIAAIPALWICAIAILVFAVIIYSIATIRPSSMASSGSRAREVARALVPILIVIAAATPVMKSKSAVDLPVFAVKDQTRYCIGDLAKSSRAGTSERIAALRCSDRR